MALEASDMSDGAILEGTQQFQNGNGQVQFKIVLPSGRELASEWLAPDMKKKAMVAWLDVVKAEAMSDADQVRQNAREVAMKERQSAAQRAQEPTPETVSTSGPTSAPARQDVSVNAAPATGSVSSPDAFVEAGLQAAQADYDYWHQQAYEAAMKMAAAMESRQKWSNIQKALEGHEQSNSSGSPGAGSNSPGTGPKRVSRKKRVAKSTDWIAEPQPPTV
jgi:hypothetical protein